MSIKDLIGSSAEQRELFLLKFPDIDRIDVIDMYDAFNAHDVERRGDLDERNIQMMFADLGVHKTLIELRSMLSVIDFSQGQRVQFLELCCAVFGKDFAHVLDHTDHEAVENAKAAAAAKQALEDDIIRTHLEEEEKFRIEQEQYEAEQQLSGVAYMKAFHERTAKSTPDTTETNAERIKREAAFRKAQKEAAAKLKAAEEEMIAKNRSDEEVAAQVAAMAQKLKEDHDAEVAAQVEAEKAARAERKRQFNERFGGGN